MDPTNQHVLELLNVALESNLDTPPFARATGAEMWNAIVKEQRDARGRLYGVVPAEAATLYSNISSLPKGQSAAAATSGGGGGGGDDSMMDLSIDSNV